MLSESLSKNEAMEKNDKKLRKNGKALTLKKRTFLLSEIHWRFRNSKTHSVNFQKKNSHSIIFFWQKFPRVVNKISKSKSANNYSPLEIFDPLPFTYFTSLTMHYCIIQGAMEFAWLHLQWTALLCYVYSNEKAECRFRFKNKKEQTTELKIFFLEKRQRLIFRAC